MGPEGEVHRPAIDDPAARIERDERSAHVGGIGDHVLGGRPGEGEV
jgi:hypothetical protein